MVSSTLVLKKPFFSVRITSLCPIRSFMISSTSGLSRRVTLAILSKDFTPLPMASNTIKWLGLSLILTLDISLVICTKQNLNSILRVLFTSQPHFSLVQGVHLGLIASNSYNRKHFNYQIRKVVKN